MENRVLTDPVAARCDRVTTTGMIETNGNKTILVTAARHVKVLRVALLLHHCNQERHGRDRASGRHNSGKAALVLRVRINGIGKLRNLLVSQKIGDAGSK